MRDRVKTLRQGEERIGNRKLGNPSAEVRAATCRLVDAGARRRAVRRVWLLAGLLDGGEAPGIQV
jgi:hypothetical protein